MSELFKNSVNTIFLFIVFLLFIGVLVFAILGLSNIGYTSNYFTFFFYLLYFAGILPLFFAFWLVFSDKTRGDWKFACLAFVLFVMLLYYHYLSIFYALTSVDNFKYLLVIDEFILVYVLMSVVKALSLGLRNDGLLDEESNLEIFQSRFKFLLTFFLLSLFALFFYEALGDYSKTILPEANFSVKTFPYPILLEALLNSGLLPLIFTLWIIYSPLVKGNVYYYITLVFVLVFIYSFQVFFIVGYYHAYPDNRLGYWILEAIVLVMLYMATVISIAFSDKNQLVEDKDDGSQLDNKNKEEITDRLESE